VFDLPSLEGVEKAGIFKEVDRAGALHLRRPGK